jgi:hypothetical protein
MQKNRKIQFKKGFSIGEVVLSAFVLSMALVAILSLISNSLKHSADSRNQVIATELAQEGLELVRSIRDNNVAQGRSVFSNLDSTSSNGGCVDVTMDGSGAAIPQWGTNLKCIDTDGVSGETFGDHRLKLCGNAVYLHTNSWSMASCVLTDTRFYRKIIIDGTVLGQRKVTSMVYWGEDGSFPSTVDCLAGNKCEYAEDVLKDWR